MPRQQLRARSPAAGQARATGLTWPPRSIHWRPRQQRPERHRPGDAVVAVVLAALLLAGGIVLWRTSSVAHTTDRVAAAAITAPPAATGIPAGFAEAWRAPSAATVAPAVVGPAVVTADAGQVSGRDARTGAEAWTFTRDRPLCTVAGGFPFSDDQRGRVLALYEGSTGFCSELTALRPDTGGRVAARNSDVVPGTQLVADDTFVLQTGERYLEVIRSDLVKTLEYGAVIAPAQPDRQPRTGCRYSSMMLAERRLGVVERCPDEATDRLTALSPDPDDSEKPEEQFSVLLADTGPATVVTLSADRVAVARPDPPRLQLFDAEGSEVEQIPLDDVPAADLATDRPARVAEVQPAGKDRLSWWTGSSTVALDAGDLTPRWTLPDTLGPALAYGDGLLVPVRAGLADVDPRTGRILRIIPVPRADPGAAVRLGAAGEILLEQRGSELVALSPR